MNESESPDVFCTPFPSQCPTYDNFTTFTIRTLSDMKVNIS